MKMMILYEPEKKGRFIDSKYGNIPWPDFLEKEAKRIGKQPNRVVEIKDNCLYVNKVAG
jgi:hypothetical protein